jgi:hypothetical protein
MPQDSGVAKCVKMFLGGITAPENILKTSTRTCYAAILRHSKVREDVLMGTQDYVIWESHDSFGSGL